ncbi:hypothetical protein [Klebsiella phage 37P2]|nr:hypothetical protein [Klebsiella phage 37P2]
MLFAVVDKFIDICRNNCAVGANKLGHQVIAVEFDFDERCDQVCGVGVDKFAFSNHGAHNGFALAAEDALGQLGDLAVFLGDHRVILTTNRFFELFHLPGLLRGFLLRANTFGFGFLRTLCGFLRTLCGFLLLVEKCGILVFQAINQLVDFCLGVGLRRFGTATTALGSVVMFFLIREKERL